MSRRSHHGGRRHGRTHRPAERRPAAPSVGAPPVAHPTPDLDVGAGRPAADVEPNVAAEARLEATMVEPEPGLALLLGPGAALPRPPEAESLLVVGPPPPRGRAAPPPAGGPAEGPPTERAGCTVPQLRRFIKSRAYVPMHELRRRFAIDSAEDDVTPVDLDARRVYVGLPEREGRMLGELLRGGDVGYEISLDPIAPIVIGLYPMRPVPRP